MVLGLQSLPVRLEAAAPGHQKHLVLLLGDGVDGERHRGGRHVDDSVDLVDVEPLPHDVGADVRLVLVVGEHDLDLVVALVRLAEILDRLLCRPHRALTRKDRNRCRTGRS